MENDPAGPPLPTYGKFHMFNGFYSFPNKQTDEPYSRAALQLKMLLQEHIVQWTDQKILKTGKEHNKNLTIEQSKFWQNIFC